MSSPFRTPPRLPLAALALCALAGCAESDLEALHAERLGDALGARAPDPTSAEADPREPGTGAARPPAGEEAVDPDDHTLVFADEFDALGLDPARWGTAMPWGPDLAINGELQYHADTLGDDAAGGHGPVERSPFSFDGETLTIAATPVADAPDTPEGLRAAAAGRTWVSGVLTTAGRFDFTYGRLEARVELPVGRGLWPSIRMLPVAPVDLSPQVYVMERDGGRPDRLYHGYEFVAADGTLRSQGPFEVVGEGLSAGFHTIGLSWSPGELVFHVDGRPRHRIVGEAVPSQPMYLALGLAVGGTWPGEPDATTPVPANWSIDYVRVWRRNDAAY